MLATDRDALACDLWETYHVEDMEALPVKTLAVLSCGLRDESRIKELMYGKPANEDRIILAGLFDALTQIRWMLGGPQGEAPKSLVSTLLGIENDDNSDEVLSFATPEEWEAARQQIIGEN